MFIIMHIIAYHKHNIFIATVHFDAIVVHSLIAHSHCTVCSVHVHNIDGVLRDERLAGFNCSKCAQNVIHCLWVAYNFYLVLFHLIEHKHSTTINL